MGLYSLFPGVRIYRNIWESIVFFFLAIGGDDISVTGILYLFIVGARKMKEFNPFRTDEDLIRQARRVQWKRNAKAICSMMRSKKSTRLATPSRILDVGTRSPMTEYIERRFGFCIENTGKRDLNYPREPEGYWYHLIIFSHVIEHLCNPLTALDSMNRILSIGGEMIVALPQRNRYQQTSSHFHEIDDRRMRYLFKKSSFDVLDYNSYNNPPAWHKVIGRIRPMWYYSRQNMGVYLVKPNNEIILPG